jgi:hypothetical protein
MPAAGSWSGVGTGRAGTKWTIMGGGDYAAASIRQRLAAWLVKGSVGGVHALNGAHGVARYVHGRTHLPMAGRAPGRAGSRGRALQAGMCSAAVGGRANTRASARGQHKVWRGGLALGTAA